MPVQPREPDYVRAFPDCFGDLEVELRGAYERVDEARTWDSTCDRSRALHIRGCNVDETNARLERQRSTIAQERPAAA